MLRATPFASMRIISNALSTLCLFWLVLPAARAQVPQTLSYQGYLEDNTGAPLNTTATLTFSLWTDPTSTNPADLAWTETYPDVAITDGLYTVSLGSVTSFASQGLAFDQAYWLEITVNAGSGPVTLSPRTALQAVSYAFHALNAGSASSAWSLTGNGGTGPGTNYLGTTDNVALEVMVNQERALRIEPTADAPNVIGGHASNEAALGTVGATIGGGGSSAQPNVVADHYGTVGGGIGNEAGSDYATVGGGSSNTARTWSTVGGGDSNTANGDGSTVGGGVGNEASSVFATVGGGFNNAVDGYYSTVGGGGYNTVFAAFGTIGGGGGDDPTDGNLVIDEGGTVAGGRNNQAGDAAGTATDAPYATVGGGNNNTASDDYATVGGGNSNTASDDYATVGGGRHNAVTAAFGTIGGGGSVTVEEGNRVTDEYGTIGGGGNNQAGDNAGTTTDAPYATVSGGFSNAASGYIATVGGGDGNTASGYIATVSGGRTNTASNKYATVPGGLDNTASGEISFAAGRRAQASHNGAFVWGDYTDADIASTANNQFIARASGGTYIYSNSGATTGVQLSPGAGSWTSASSVHLKTDFEAIDPGAILTEVAALPISQWRYKAEAAGLRHVGPTAEGITSVDADGVALAAIQGLHALLVEKDAQIEALQRQLDDLQAQVSLLLQERQP